MYAGVNMRRTAAAGHRQTGIVALEFVLLFPFIIALLYAAAVYGIVFLTRYRMQNAVQAAVQSGLYVDRSAYSSSQLGPAVTTKTNATLQTLVSALPLTNISVGGANTCALVSGGAMVHCHLAYQLKANPIVPVMSFGILGTFPPLPSTLTVDAYAAF